MNDIRPVQVGTSARYLLLLATLCLGGCAGPAWILEPLMYRNDGGMSPATKADIWIATTESSIASEIAGRTPTGGIPTWQEWWQNRYALARKKRPELADFCVRYIKTRRQQMGLPLDDTDPFLPVSVKRKDATLYFEDSVMATIDAEKQGKPPFAYANTWPEYWRHGYELLERYVDSELAAAHRKIIHKQRRKARLPLYDPSLAE